MSPAIGWLGKLNRVVVLPSLKGAVAGSARWLLLFMVLGGVLSLHAPVGAQSDPGPRSVSKIFSLDSQKGQLGDQGLDLPDGEVSDHTLAPNFFQQASDEAIVAWLRERVQEQEVVLTAKEADGLIDWAAQTTSARFSVKEAAQVYFDTGRLVFRAGRDEQALEFFLRAAQLSNSDNALASIKRWVGDVYAVTGAFEPALEAYLEGLQVAKGGDDVEVELLLSLGDVSRKLKETDQALGYLERAEEVAQAAGLSESLTRVYLLRAAVYRSMSANERALLTYEQGLALALNIDDPVLHAMFYNNIGNVLRDMSEFAESLTYFDQALAISEAEGREYGVGINHINQALVHYLKGEYESALTKYEMADAILGDMDRPSEQRAVYEGFAYTHQALGQHEKAFDALLRFNEINEEIMNKEIRVASKEIQTRYETLLKDSQLALQDAEIGEQRRTLQMASIVIVSLLAIVGGLIGFMRDRSKKFQALYQRNKELMLANSKARQMRQLHRLSAATLPDTPVLDHVSVPEGEQATNERMQALFEQIVALFEEGKMFTQPDVSISDVASRLATNRTYVSQAIAHGSNMNFPTFLNFYRVTEARRLLHEDERAWSAQSLATEVGYGSISSMYRAFERHVGMSPARYAEAIRLEREGKGF